MTNDPPVLPAPADLSRLSRDGLVNKIRQLESELHRAHAVATANGVAIPPRSPTPTNAADASANGAGAEGQKKRPGKLIKPYNTRMVALKIAYLGKNYGGFEFAASAVAPTVEEVLWKALVRGYLIVPDDPDRIDWLPFQYSKCGRTDRGVSAFGQVISIRLRSSKPVPKAEPDDEAKPESEESRATHEQSPSSQQHNHDPESSTTDKQKEPQPQAREWDPIKDEINYGKAINRLLPPDVQVLAWCPTVPDTFDARHSCGERQYRYFFTQPAFAPLPHILETAEVVATQPRKRRRSRAQSPPELPVKKYKEGWLDIDAMRQAAGYFVGSHDFRNFCRIDGGKQITEFTRRLFDVRLEEVEDVGSVVPYVSGELFRPKGFDLEGKVFPKVYSLNIYGNAFLWNQIRCMVGVLFLVGQGLEKPSIVEELLDVDKYPGKPQYLMADPVPLVLWDCLFPEGGKSLDSRGEDTIDWIHQSDVDLGTDHGPHGMYNHLWSRWREKKMDEILTNRLLKFYSQRGNHKRRATGHDDSDVKSAKKVLARRFRRYTGENDARTEGRFVPIHKSQVQPSPEKVNDNFAKRKGFASSSDMRSRGNWLAEVRARKGAALTAKAQELGRAATRADGVEGEKPSDFVAETESMDVDEPIAAAEPA